MPKRPKNQRTPEKRELDRVEMVRLFVRGWTKTEIAKKFNLSYGTITNDFDKVLEELAEGRTKDADKLRAWKMEEYAQLKKEAWEAWERSKTDIKRITEEERVGSPDDGDEGGLEKRTTMVEGRLPDTGYLRIIATCLEAERELDGLNAATKVDQTIHVDWDVFARGQGSQGQVDTIEAQIKAIAYDKSTAGPIIEGPPQPEDAEVVASTPPPEAPETFANFSEDVPEPESPPTNSEPTPTPKPPPSKKLRPDYKGRRK